jgi:septal ring-binding cell division protein DamX
LLAGLLSILQGCTATPPRPVETAYAEAEAAYLAHDYQRTKAIVGPRAIAGEPWAQYTLGYMYYYGQGVALDSQMAKHWIQLAAKQNYAPAQYALDRMTSQQPPRDVSMDSSISDGVVSGVAAGMDKQQAAQPSSQPMATTTSPTPPATIMGPAGASQTEQADNGIKGHNWIAAQDPQQFTVQLIGFGNEMAAIRYIHNNHLESQSAYYSTRRFGRPWFAVIYGKFSSRDAAHQALKRLPSVLRSASPWVRSFRDIQALSTP